MVAGAPAAPRSARWASQRDPVGHYAVLGIAGKNRDATAADISGAFRRELMKWHPDHYAGDDDEFANQRTRLVIEAYKILRNPAKRAAYDSRGMG